MKRISPGTVTVGVLAILFGLVAAYAARRYFDVTPLAQTPVKPKTATVVVPRINLPKYARIREQDVDVVEVLAKNVPEGAVRLKSRVLFRLVKETVLAGKPVLEKDLFGVGEVPMMSDRLPPGYRAVTLAVDANSALNGMIQPDSIVDITLTATNDRPEVGGLATLTLLQGVKVLATSRSRFPASEDRPGDMRNITVAVTPEQANKLILAQRYGTLSCTLRGSVEGDVVAANDDGRNLVNPLGLLGLSPITPEPFYPAPAQKTAQIWRGGAVTEVTFNSSAIQEALNATAVAEGREPTQAVPVSSQQTESGKKPCTACEAKKAKRRAAMQRRPTLAPATSEPTAATPALPGLDEPSAQSTQAVPAGYGALSTGQVLQVRVEAEQVGKTTN